MPYNVKSIKSLAKLLDVDVEELVRIEQNPEKYYEPFEKKRGEKSRSIDNPTGELAALQIRIKKFLLCDVDVFRPIATGGVKGHSTKTSALLHTNKDCVATVDVKSFFPCVTNNKVYKVFCNLGYSPPVSRMLTRITTYKGHLPQGSATSTIIANLALYNFDEYLYNQSLRLGCDCIRFVDDIIISGSYGKVTELVSLVFPALHRMRFSVHRAKKLKIMKSNKRQEVLGLTVNRAVGVTKSYVEEVRTQIACVEKCSVTSCVYLKLVGKIQYIGTTKPIIAGNLMRKLRNSLMRPEKECLASIEQ